MKKKKSLFIILVSVLSLLSCNNEITTLEGPSEQSQKIKTKSAGDTNYDVLGYGYDVTGEYLHPLSVKCPVIDIEKYKQEQGGRLITGTSTFGRDKMYCGYSSLDYTNDIATQNKIDASVSSQDSSTKSTNTFSGSISNYFKSEYSYSSKYSFASVDAIRNLKFIKISDNLNGITQYLTKEFIEDMNRLSADKLVKRYGTHVLTNIIIGGRYKLMFRSIITKTRDASTKRKAVIAGFSGTLKTIQFKVNLEHSVEIDESLAKENQNKELFVLYYGGNGTNLKYDLEKGMPTTVDMKGWEDGLKLQNACLTDINWENAYPLYEFISDPTKKAEVKIAIENYIESKKLNMLELLPLYRMYWEKGKDTHYVTTWDDVIKYQNKGHKYETVLGYIIATPGKNRLPMYRLYWEKGTNTHYVTTWDEVTKYQSEGHKYETILGYINKNMDFETVPMYRLYWEEGTNTHYVTTWDEVTKYQSEGHKYETILGYIYPPE
ncbi:MAC/perforin domain-containing protein [uncultured Bacteroides sp.]|uniref:MAC/perforin domain-containing protein n=1 Tax=uncultured Bacteroides sp. TaxID=162156 RepID=UPI002AA5FC9E|nr:MAC/perforin domain-containing protein [uncultured Bacteroides sp.]